MGAGQIGGLATLLELDFDNVAGFLGEKADKTEAQFVAYYLSHAMIFCAGVIIEAHVVLTPASCVYGEKYKFEIFGGSHKFMENKGISRTVNNICLHRGYNHSARWKDCHNNNLALLILNKQFTFHLFETGADYILNRVRYGRSSMRLEAGYKDPTCRIYGWGSRRNGFLIPLLFHLYRLEVTLLPSKYCSRMWNYGDRYLCIRQPHCKDDLGSVVVCSGYALGMMTSQIIDRPCGVGFIDLTKYSKFLNCGIDDTREVIDHDEIMEFEYTTESLMTLYTTTTVRGVTESDEVTTSTAKPARYV